MNESSFSFLAKLAVKRFYDMQEGKTLDLRSGDIYIVWMSKTLQNNKAMLSTTEPDGRYFEVTYNGNKNEMYFDAYKKELNEALRPLDGTGLIKIEEDKHE